MNATPDEIERRSGVALEAIRSRYGTAGDEHGVSLFVSHHLDEIGEDFWLKHCGVSRPEPKQVLDLLILCSEWDEEDEEGIDLLDFTLPDGVTNYLISVEFDESGNVESITMES